MTDANILTKKICKFLENKGWVITSQNLNFIILRPPAKLGFSATFQLSLPIYSSSKEFSRYMENILTLLRSIYNSKYLEKFLTINDKMKNKFTSRWIEPEYDSKVEKIKKYSIYIPHEK